MRIRWRLALYAVVVATIGMTAFAILLSSLVAGGVEEDQDVALSELAGTTAASVETGEGLPDGFTSWSTPRNRAIRSSSCWTRTARPSTHRA